MDFPTISDVTAAIAGADASIGPGSHSGGGWAPGQWRAYCRTQAINSLLSPHMEGTLGWLVPADRGERAIAYARRAYAFASARRGISTDAAAAASAAWVARR